MIRYPVTKEQLEAQIEDEKPGWLKRARARTAKFRKKGYYDESSSIWNEVKVVYMRLQGGGKCAYCERAMESVEFGKIEQDVEHFRPKGNVANWNASAALTAQGITFTSPPPGRGYHLLPYHPFNYAAACKPCNSILKKDYFPVAGLYHINGDDPTSLNVESPYLIYPIGTIDDDPESLINFHGPSPKPVATTGYGRHRALVTIEFFQLDNHDSRKNLYRERCLVIVALYSLLEGTVTGPAAKRVANDAKLNGFLAEKLAHLNCARSFKRLFYANPTEARAVRDAAADFMISIS